MAHSRERKSVEATAAEKQRRLEQALSAIVKAQSDRVYGVVEVHFQGGTIVRTRSTRTDEIE